MASLPTKPSILWSQIIRGWSTFPTSFHFVGSTPNFTRGSNLLACFPYRQAHYSCKLVYNPCIDKYILNPIKIQHFCLVKKNHFTYRILGVFSCISNTVFYPNDCFTNYWWELLYIYICIILIEGSLEVKLPTIWTDEKQSRAEAERRGRLEERRSEEKE